MNSPQRSLAEIAADWAVRLDAGPLSQAEASALQAWLDADAAHGAELAAVLDLQRCAGAMAAEMAAAGEIEVPAAASASGSGRGWRRLGTWAGAVGAALLVLWFAALPRAEPFVTAEREQREVTLADGSTVWLNAATTLDVTLTRGRRVVRLREGEAFFEVATDAARPFLVETPAGRVRVTGTQFNVWLAAADRVEVTVAEGSVEVTPAQAAAEPQVLRPGDVLEVGGTQRARRRLAGTDLAARLAWRAGRLALDDTPLADAVARLARFHGRPVVVDESAVGLRLGGDFDLDDFDGFLEDVERTLPVVVLRAPGAPVRITAR